MRGEEGCQQPRETGESHKFGEKLQMVAKHQCFLFRPKQVS